jgi:hypothetical protein
MLFWAVSRKINFQKPIDTARFYMVKSAQPKGKQSKNHASQITGNKKPPFGGL